MTVNTDPPLVVVTRGPAFEPIDQVRRLTNFSTGELGSQLAVALAEAGYHPVLFSGQLSTTPVPSHDRIKSRQFSTNEDLAAALQALAGSHRVHALFHCAALCDYRVRTVTTAHGEGGSGKKLPSRAGNLTMELEPARKVINDLRLWFPESRLIGWKYELEGDRSSAIQRARQSIASNRLDLGVVNGAAFGPGFGLLNSKGELQQECPDKGKLCEALVGWLTACR